MLLPLLTSLVLSCSHLAQAGPPVLVITEPRAIQADSEQDGVLKLEVNVWRRTYAVSGSSAEEVGRNLDALRPVSGDGDYRAETQWDLHWSLRYDHGPGSCAIAGLTLQFEALVTLPELGDGAVLPAADLDRWQRYADALEQHEQGHLTREIEAARDLAHRLAGLGDLPDCAGVAAAVSSMGEQAKTAIRTADAAFDAGNGHGALSGASFP